MQKKKGKYVRKKIIVRGGSLVRVTKYISGRIGSRDQRRKKKEATTERVMRWQDKRAEDTVWGLLEENFLPGDIFATLTYPPKTRKKSEEYKADISEFRKRLRREYRKREIPMKYIITAGIGKRGAAHIHGVFNRIDADIIEQVWQDVAGTEACPYPSVNVKYLDRSGNWPRLAAYIIKNGLESFRSGDPIFKRRYIASTNLKKPKVVRTIIRANWWSEVPSHPKGYEVLKDSVRDGMTGAGFPYQTYTLQRIERLQI